MSDDGVIRGGDGVTRCWWSDSAPEYRDYHDREWGFPAADDVRLFEKLCHDGCDIRDRVERERAAFERPR